MLGTLLALNGMRVVAQTADRPQNVTRHWGLGFGAYSPYREDHYSLPLWVIGVGGGKLGPNEKFKIRVYLLGNRSDKSIRTVDLRWYLFNYDDFDKLLDTGITTPIEIHLLPDEERQVDLLVTYLENIPFLRDTNPHGSFFLEVGVGKITYDDGSTWEATANPGKFDYSKAPNLRKKR